MVLPGEQISPLHIVEQDRPGPDLFLFKSLAFTVQYKSDEKKEHFVCKIWVLVRVAVKEMESILFEKTLLLTHHVKQLKTI